LIESATKHYCAVLKLKSSIMWPWMTLTLVQGYKYFGKGKCQNMLLVYVIIMFIHFTLTFKVTWRVRSRSYRGQVQACQSCRLCLSCSLFPVKGSLKSDIAICSWIHCKKGNGTLVWIKQSRTWAHVTQEAIFFENNWALGIFPSHNVTCWDNNF
jgi:hypothetical protein